MEKSYSSDVICPFSGAEKSCIVCTLLYSGCIYLELRFEILGCIEQLHKLRIVNSIHRRYGAICEISFVQKVMYI
jgi:hypothetical protein